MNYLVDLIIRPKRNYYNQSDLGQTVFTYGGQDFKRMDFDKTIKNSNDEKITASFWCPLDMTSNEISDSPCIIYCHGNAGNKLDITDIFEFLCYEYNLCSFDFSGAGYSEGKYVTLGYKEYLDLKSIVEFLRKELKISNIIIWGRSMGAVSALRYAEIDPNIKAIVLDSPFAHFPDLIKELFNRFMIPNFLFNYLFNLSQDRILEKIPCFDIKNFIPEKNAKNVYVPTILIHGVSDSLVPVSHSSRIYKKIPTSYKKLLEVKGDHNDQRSNSDIILIRDFITNFTYDPIVLKEYKRRLLIKNIHYKIYKTIKKNELEVKKGDSLNELLYNSIISDIDVKKENKNEKNTNNSIMYTSTKKHNFEIGVKPKFKHKIKNELLDEKYDSDNSCISFITIDKNQCTNIDNNEDYNFVSKKNKIYLESKIKKGFKLNIDNGEDMEINLINFNTDNKDNGNGKINLNQIKKGLKTNVNKRNNSIKFKKIIKRNNNELNDFFSNICEKDKNSNKIYKTNVIYKSNNEENDHNKKNSSNKNIGENNKILRDYKEEENNLKIKNEVNKEKTDYNIYHKRKNSSNLISNRHNFDDDFSFELEDENVGYFSDNDISTMNECEIKDINENFEDLDIALLDLSSNSININGQKYKYKGHKMNKHTIRNERCSFLSNLYSNSVKLNLDNINISKLDKTSIRDCKKQFLNKYEKKENDLYNNDRNQEIMNNESNKKIILKKKTTKLFVRQLKKNN